MTLRSQDARDRWIGDENSHASGRSDANAKRWLLPALLLMPLAWPFWAATLEASGDEVGARIARVESGLPAVILDGEPPLKLTLEEWMRALDIPGLSIAVIDEHRIDWARGYGVRDVDTDQPVTDQTLFQAASISKPVTALAVLRQVERGAFELDANINRYLRSWKLERASSIGGDAVTLRHLLAHSAGITPGGFLGYERGTPVPSLVQILDGGEPATNARAEVVAPPGSGVAYSGLGYTLLQLALIDQLGKPFDELMRTLVLEPIGLHDSTFAQELPNAFSQRAASGHDVEGDVIAGRWMIHPEMAAAGLWTTPSDLATLAIAVGKMRTGGPGEILSPETTAVMLTPHRDEMGLGFVVKPGDSTGFFAHAGGNQGFRCYLRLQAEPGKGLVVMTNSDNGGLIFRPLMHSVAREYDWPGYESREVSPDVLRRIKTALRGDSLRVDPALLAEYAGRYELAPGLVFDVRRARDRLLVQLGDQPRLPVYPESETRFFYKVVNAQITFVRDQTGAVSALILHQNGQDQEAKRLE